MVYHINYYVSVVLEVLQGAPLNASDKYSFDLPPVQSAEAWEKLTGKTFTDAENFTALLEQMPEDKLAEDFSEGKYGSYYRNIQGIIEHTHYHLGQIVLIKKIILQAEVNGV